KRVEEDMGLPLYQVSTFERVEWIQEKFNLKESIYMGDGVFDAMVFDKVAYAIAPANAFEPIKKHADYVTKSRGAEGAVAEACFHIMEKFFTPLDILNLRHGGGVWGKK
ncbi:MAG: HAD hydrolase family protein, partial [bacterium]|nr:HAD hydrolase family protein [bacterium]